MPFSSVYIIGRWVQVKFVNLNRTYEYKNVDNGLNKFEKDQYLQKRYKTIQTEK